MHWSQGLFQNCRGCCCCDDDDECSCERGHANNVILIVEEDEENFDDTREDRYSNKSSSRSFEDDSDRREAAGPLVHIGRLFSRPVNSVAPKYSLAENTNNTLLNYADAGREGQSESVNIIRNRNNVSIVSTREPDTAVSLRRGGAPHSPLSPLYFSDHGPDIVGPAASRGSVEVQRGPRISASVVGCNETQRNHSFNKTGPIRAIQRFVRHIQQHFQEGANKTLSPPLPTSSRMRAADHQSTTGNPTPNRSRSEPRSIVSPLHAASSFDTSQGDVFTIAKDEVVVPGSPLQFRMSQAMLASMPMIRPYQSPSDSNRECSTITTTCPIAEDECVICLESFDQTNPRIPTLCGCGTNKTYFHLPCLYRWIEKSQNCPSCRQRLQWDEL
jgi:hypothetical protein